MCEHSLASLKTTLFYAYACSNSRQETTVVRRKVSCAWLELVQTGEAFLHATKSTHVMNKKRAFVTPELTSVNVRLHNTAECALGDNLVLRGSGLFDVYVLK